MLPALTNEKAALEASDQSASCPVSVRHSDDLWEIGRKTRLAFDRIKLNNFDVHGVSPSPNPPFC